MSLAELWVDVRLGFDKADRDLAQGARKIDGEPAGRKVGRRFAAGFSASLKGLGTVVAGIVSVKAIHAVSGLAQEASDLNETVSKSQNIFGKNAKSIESWATTAATSMGISKQAALDGASAFGNFFDQIGIGGKQSVRMSKGLVALSSNLASFNNADPAQVMEAFQSATRGEYDSLQAFIPTVNAATVQTEALRLSHKKNAKDLTDAEKATALYSIAQRDAGKAQGDFSRTSGGLANQQRILHANMANLRTILGGALLPAFQSGAQILNTQVLPPIMELAHRHAPALRTALASIVPAALEIFAVLSNSQKPIRGPFEEEGPFIQGLFKARAAFAQIIPTVKDFFASLKAQGAGGSLKSITESMVTLAPAVREFVSQAHGVGPALSVGAAVLKFFADHVSTLIKYMPVLVGAFVAFKVAQLAANVAAALSVPTKVAEVIVNRQLVKSNRELIASRVQLTTSVVTGTAVETGATVAKSRGVVATVAQRVASIAAAVATNVLTIATRAYGIALKIAAGPIGWVIAAIGILIPLVIALYKNNDTFRRIVDQAWKVVQRVIKVAWENFIFPIIKLYIAYLKFLWEAAKKAASFIKAAWDLIVASAKLAWKGLKAVFGVFADTYRDTRDGFKAAAGAIGDAFNKLKDAAKKPINFIIGTVYDQGIRGFWGKIKGALGIKGFDLPYIPTLARGGMFNTPTAIVGEGNTTAPEYVIPTDPRHRKRAVALYEDLGTRLMAGGGIIGRLGGIAEWFTNPLGKFKELAQGPLNLLKNVGGGAFGQIISAIPRAVISGLKGKVTDWFKGGFGGIGGSGIGAIGWMRQMAILRTAFPGLPLISGFRPGAITATGNLSYHARGRAVDIPPIMAVFEWIRSHFGASSKELIFSRAGNRQIKNGRPHYYSGITRAMHFNHIHWAMANGGIINEPIFGVGRSGRTYSFGERGPEMVTPGRGGSGATLVNYGPITTQDVENWFIGVQSNVRRHGRS